MKLLKRLLRSSSDSNISDAGRSKETGKFTSNLGLGFDHRQEQFEYTALKHPRSFRVLRLELNFSDVRKDYHDYRDLILRGSLIEASIDKAPKYFALSYTWGPEELSDQIIIDGMVLRLTVNCGAALRRMLKGKTSRMVWVDSICINQSSLDEKSHQVAMMDEIYRHAFQVIVHLGEGDQASDVAFQAIKSLSVAYLAAKLPGPLQRAARTKYDEIADDVVGTFSTASSKVR